MQSADKNDVVEFVLAGGIRRCTKAIELIQSGNNRRSRIIPGVAV